ncbi:MAG: hypothetical protein ACQETL_19055 [Bacteroidota bacterium]
MQSKSKRLEILEASSIKKEASLNAKFETHFASVKQANGQPLNDKRNGQATLNKWERQNEAIRNQKESIKKTKNAIEKEKDKIAGVEYAKETLPACILELVEKGELVQWRKHPNTFFVKGVDKARICWDNKKRLIFTRYKDSITDKDVWKIFATTFNTLLKQIQYEQKGTS